MFESLFSFGSLLSITISVTLTIRMLKLTYINKGRYQSPDIQGDNNRVIINNNYLKKVSDFKSVSNIIIAILVFCFPLIPDFFINFLSSFSLCSIIICFFGVFKNILARDDNAFFGLLYIPATIIISFLAISSISIIRMNNYLYTDYYSRLIGVFNNAYPSIDYANEIISIFGEGFAYGGLAYILSALIHTCFGFLNKDRNFDMTFGSVKYWVPTAFVAHFLASGCLIYLLHQKIGYIAYTYKNIFNYFLVYFF